MLSPTDIKIKEPDLLEFISFLEVEYEATWRKSINVSGKEYLALKHLLLIRKYKKIFEILKIKKVSYTQLIEKMEAMEQKGTTVKQETLF
ncbi:MAG: hypothetical protein AAFO07_30790 [Bacteroidota bacterium]